MLAAIFATILTAATGSATALAPGYTDAQRQDHGIGGVPATGQNASPANRSVPPIYVPDHNVCTIARERFCRPGEPTHDPDDKQGGACVRFMPSVAPARHMPGLRMHVRTYVLGNACPAARLTSDTAMLSPPDVCVAGRQCMDARHFAEVYEGQHRPVLISGLMDGWQARVGFGRTELLAKHGQTKVCVAVEVHPSPQPSWQMPPTHTHPHTPTPTPHTDHMASGGPEHACSALASRNPWR